MDRQPLGILFDFAGTLFDHEPHAQTLQAVGVPADVAHELRGPFGRMRNLIGSPAAMPTDLRRAWKARDLSESDHRAAFVGLMTHVGVPASVAEPFCVRAHSPSAWFPFADTRPILRELRQAGMPVGIVSNIGWDIRVAFDRFDLLDCVDGMVLSCELGVAKPDGLIFEAACRTISVQPRDVVMVGDSRYFDGGARSIGCQVALVPTPRPNAALRVALAPHVGMD